MTKLNDIQSILLSTAAQREGGSLLPVSEELAEKEPQARTAIDQLIKRGLATEIESADPRAAYRKLGDRQLGAIISDAGKQAIGFLDVDAESEPSSVGTETKSPPPGSKQATVMELLCWEQSATISELQEATGWLPHTTRAALTGIRKRNRADEDQSREHHPLQGGGSPVSIEEQIEQLRTMSLAQLKDEWRRVCKGAAPAACTADLLMRGIAYRIQEKAFGGLSAEAKRELDSIATVGKSRPSQTPSVQLRPGNRLVRRWRGSTYSVDVTREGFVFQERRYASLSTIATEITGTRWSGPRFFGLRVKQQ